MRCLERAKSAAREAHACGCCGSRLTTRRRSVSACSSCSRCSEQTALAYLVMG